MSKIEDQNPDTPGQHNETIEPRVFVPSDSKPRRARLALWQIVLLAFATTAVAIFWFLFTSKSVLLEFQPQAAQVSVSGGFAFELGGVYLLREGEYEISAQTPLYEPLQETIRVGSERNQRIALEFVPLPGFLTLQLSPTDASIELNGQPEQVTPRIELAAGQHEITVSHPRYI